MEANETEIEYKRLSENELDVFIEMRINQVREEGAKEDIDLKPALQDYYKRHMKEGIAKELLHRVVEEAGNYGCGTIQITVSDMGVKLYSAYGFVHNGNFMQYKL